jgi:hypothetical protein
MYTIMLSHQIMGFFAQRLEYALRNISVALGKKPHRGRHRAQSLLGALGVTAGKFTVILTAIDFVGLG